MITETDNFIIHVCPLPSLVALAAKACVLHCELFLTCLDDTILPKHLCRLLVEMHQRTDAAQVDRRRRLYAALRDSTGRSPWSFPGNPLVFPTTGSSMHLDYLDATFPLNELVECALPVTGLSVHCRGAALKIPPTIQLSLLVAYEATCVCLEASQTLVRLELLDCCLPDVEFLPSFRNLEWLCLANLTFTAGRPDLLPLCRLQKLRHLDLTGIQTTDDRLVTILVMELPLLEYLDVSETRLEVGGLCELRQANPLQFLGLYRTSRDPCMLPNLPAKVVSGTANARQRAAAAEFCSDVRRQHLFFESTECWKTKLNYLVQLMHMWLRKRQPSNIANTLDVLRNIFNQHAKEIPVYMKHIVFETVMDYIMAGCSCEKHVHLVVRILRLLPLLLSDVSEHSAMSVGRYVSLCIFLVWRDKPDLNYIYLASRKIDANVFGRCVYICEVVTMLNSQLLTVLKQQKQISPVDRMKKIDITEKIVRWILNMLGRGDGLMVDSKFMNSVSTSFDICYIHRVLVYLNTHKE